MMKLQACLVATLLVAQHAGATVIHSVGVARDARDATIQYVEHHQYLDSGDHLVTYFDPSGAVLATKSLRYPGLPQHPQIQQSDFTRDLDVAAYVSDDTLKVVSNADGRATSYELPLDPSTIVDAGFDSFLRANWNRFEEGRAQPFKFTIAGQSRVLSVDVTMESTSDEATAFSVAPRNFFLRLLLPELRLLYNDERRLLAYEGPTNLNLGAGGWRRVSIAFNHYQSVGQLEKPLAQWMPEGWDE